MATRNRRKLSPNVIRDASILTRRYRLWDTAVPGLFVSVAPTGIKSWNVQWSRRRSKSIGKFPGMTVETARTQALDILNDTAKNGTPAVARPTTQAPTFKAFIDEHYAPWVEVERKAGKATVANIKAQFMPLLGTKLLTDVTAWHLAKFRLARLKAGISPVTVNRDLDRIRAALGTAVKWKLLAVNPAAKMDRAQVKTDDRVRYLSPDEEKRLRKALVKAPDYLRTLTMMAINTGCRKGELLSLNWSDVDLERRQMKVAAVNSKTNRARFIPLNDEVLSVLTRIEGREGLVIPGVSGRRMTNFKRSWATLTKAAALVDFHFHDCRHHFASRLVMNGVDLYMVQQLLGHSDAEMTQRYAHIDDTHKAAAVEKLAARR